MAADEAQTRRHRPASTSARLGARHVGDDGVRGRAIAPRPGQPVEQLEARGRGRRRGRRGRRPSMADSGVVRGAIDDAVGQRAARARRPIGDQAAIVQPAVAASARTARATDPAIRPNPRKPRCMPASIAAGDRPDTSPGRSVLPARRSVPVVRRNVGPLPRRAPCGGQSRGARRRRPARRSPWLGLRLARRLRGRGSRVVAGFTRRLCSRRSFSRRSSRRNAPQRGQRRSSAKSASSGATV